ncbi:hypothetical protein E2493_08345 [Sphingomonas parva]|uniref:Uncharacterized protein n=1 Tax=Sphingomonas parva TaxID=2555898 RepID=A0A4Y8ZW29_9SPHN|nr:hypothetical protein [Sphingomonas parva]TFI58646.1 hypothetical protein E2493_08345 [Sphingomonas parva]
MKLVRIAAAAAVALLAWGCLLTPGRFDAALSVRRDGSFTYRYTGELVFVSPGSAAAGIASEDEPFKPEDQVCYENEDDVLGDTHDCTPAEIEQKRKEYEEGRADRLAEKKKQAEMTKAMLGGIDPSDPKTMEEFARRLQGHAGWKRVQHKANGVFDVDYELSGRLDHDFVFPVFPEIDMIIPFVKVVRLSGNRIRVLAPAFVQPKEGGWQGMGSAMQGAVGAQAKGAAESWMKKPEGTFTLTTDAEILTNNTREGPARAAAGRSLTWTVGPLDASKPEALLQL